MRIHAYKVSKIGQTSLSDVLKYICAVPLSGRLRAIGTSSIRLEEASESGNFWSVDFGCIKHDGPGRASIDGPISDFDLEESEGFGHETALYFDKRSDYATLQYNHFGPRISSIQGYLSQIAREATQAADGGLEGLVFSPVMKAQAADRLSHIGIVKNIQVSVHVPGALASSENNGRSLGQLLRNPLVGSAETLSMRLSVNSARGRSLSIEHVKELVGDLLGHRDDVQKLEIVAKENDEAPREPIDLLEARLEAYMPLERTGRRFARETRLSALRQCFSAWVSNGQFS